MKYGPPFTKRQINRTLTVLAICVLLLTLVYYLISHYCLHAINSYSQLQMEQLEIKGFAGPVRFEGLRYRDSLNRADIYVNVGQLHMKNTFMFAKHPTMKIRDVQLDSIFITYHLDSEFSSDSSNSVKLPICMDDFSAQYVEIILSSGDSIVVKGYCTDIHLSDITSQPWNLKVDNIVGHHWVYYPNDYYRLEVDQFASKDQGRDWQLKGCRYTTDISEEAFYERVKTKQDRIVGSATDIDIRGLEMAQMMKGILDIRAIDIKGGILRVYEDTRFAHCDTCIKPLLHKKWVDSDMKCSLDSVRVMDASIHYHQGFGVPEEMIDLSFEHTYGNIQNMTNLSDEIRQNRYWLINAQCKVFDHTPFDLNVRFDLASPESMYSLDGAIGQLDMKTIGDYLVKNQKIALSSGVLLDATFHMQGNHDAIEGDVEMAYDNLSVSLLDKEGQRLNFLSSIVNPIVINKANIRSSKNFRVGRVNQNRDKSRSIFNAWIGGLTQGVANTTMKHKFMNSSKKKEKEQE